MTRLVQLDSGRLVYLPPEVLASLRDGGMVIFPTDTLYGLGVDPRSETGIRRLVAAKGRDSRKPIPLLLSGPQEVGRWARHVPEGANRLMQRFWPGPLTIVLSAAPGVHPAITGGGDTVGLRVPDHPIPRTLARGLSGAVTGTSANRSGNPGAWESAEEIVAEFTGEVDWILWDGKAMSAAGAGGGSAAGAGSTVVAMTDDRPVLLRDGVLSFRDIVEYVEKG